MGKFVNVFPFTESRNNCIDMLLFQYILILFLFIAIVSFFVFSGCINKKHIAVRSVFLEHKDTGGNRRAVEQVFR